MTNDKDSAVTDAAVLEALQKDADIPHLPTQETYQFRMAVSGQGPLAYQWSDKPHRLLYDACSIIESQAAMRQPTQSDAMREENERLRALLARTVNLAEVYAEGTGTNFKEAMAEARAALQEQSK